MERRSREPAKTSMSEAIQPSCAIAGSGALHAATRAFEWQWDAAGLVLVLDAVLVLNAVRVLDAVERCCALPVAPG